MSVKINKINVDETAESTDITDDEVQAYVKKVGLDTVPHTVDASFHFVFDFYKDYYQKQQRRLTTVIVTLSPAYRYIKYRPVIQDDIHYAEENGRNFPIYEFNLYMPYLNFVFNVFKGYGDGPTNVKGLGIGGVIGSWEEPHNKNTKVFSVFSNGNCVGYENFNKIDFDLNAALFEYIPAYLDSNFNDDNHSWLEIPWVREMNHKSGANNRHSSVAALRYWESLTPTGVRKQDYTKSYYQDIFTNNLFGPSKKIVCLRCENTDE